MILDVLKWGFHRKLFWDINSSDSIMGDIRVVSYADDTALLSSCESWTEVYSKAEQGLGRVYCWLNNDLLSLNYNKKPFS